MKTTNFYIITICFFSLLLMNIKANAQLWQRTYGGTGDDRGNSVQQTTDGGYIITGYANFTGNNDAYLIKFDYTPLIEICKFNEDK